jgi:hypothetical protein
MVKMEGNKHIVILLKVCFGKPRVRNEGRCLQEGGMVSNKNLQHPHSIV